MASLDTILSKPRRQNVDEIGDIDRPADAWIASQALEKDEPMHAREKGLIAQSGIIPFRTVAGQLQVALVTTGDGRNWTIPKGHIEPDMTPQQSAIKECFEEAGFRGALMSRQICAYRHFKRGGMRLVRVYLMRVEQQLRDWPERGRRQRRWMSPHRAALLVRSPVLRNALLRMAATKERANLQAAA